ncbi:MAG: hypothetical protein B6A08_18870 [Sorangiineae bacterium NIC37A_2]|nr:MAG: hypothetical protein B6A08_18870 [Sorangiineae bacterium NIC37A_2]
MPPHASHLDAAFAALADPTRRAIVLELTRGERMASELGRPFALSQPAISHHLRVLEEAKLIHRRAEGTKRIFRLEAERVNEIETWLSALRVALETNYARLDTLLEELCSPHPPPEEDPPQEDPPEERQTDEARTHHNRRKPGPRHSAVPRAPRGRLPRPRRN